jgi:hypothetical protein
VNGVKVFLLAADFRRYRERREHPGKTIFTKEAPMKLIPFHFFVLAAAIFVASAALAVDVNYQPLSTQNGVAVMVSYDPLGPNNQIMAYLKFINNNDYPADVTWKPVISCGDAAPKEGSGGAFHIDAKASYGVTLWRSQACGLMKIRDFTVKLEVKK